MLRREIVSNAASAAHIINEDDFGKLLEAEILWNQREIFACGILAKMIPSNFLFLNTTPAWSYASCILALGNPMNYISNLAIAALVWLQVPRKRGVTAIEYGLMAALIAVVIIGAVSLLGRNLVGVFESIARNLRGG